MKYAKAIRGGVQIPLIVYALLGLVGPTFAVESRAPAPNTTLQKVSVGNLTRTYYFHVPPALSRSRLLPLVLAFHGGGGTPAIIERESKFSDLADREGFLVAYPEGIHKTWNDGRGVKAIAAQKDNVDDIGFITALINDVARLHKVDRKRIFATGISNGGIFSHYLAANLSPQIAAIAPVAGGLSESLRDKFNPEKPVSVLIFHGTQDPMVPYNGGGITVLGAKRGRIIGTEDAARKWAIHNGCARDPVVTDLENKDPNDGCTVKKFLYQKGTDGTEVMLYRIEGGGHTWPDGLQYLPEMVIGKVCRDINGAAIMWEFFKNHPKP